MAKLAAHVLNGKIVGIETPQYSLIEEPFKIVKDDVTIPIGYVDISSINNWWNYGFDLNKDYIYIRTEIKNHVELLAIDSTTDTLSDPPSNPTIGEKYFIDPSKPAVGAWMNYQGAIATWSIDKWIIEPPEFIGYRMLDQKQKLIAAHLKIGGQLDHFQDFGVPDIVNYGLGYHKRSMEARKNRILIASVEVFNIIPAASGSVLGNLIASPVGDTYSNYERFGVKGTLEDYHPFFNPSPVPGIADYIMARFPWDGTLTTQGFPVGLARSSYMPIDGSNIEDFASILYNILIYGEYHYAKDF